MTVSCLKYRKTGAYNLCGKGSDIRKEPRIVNCQLYIVNFCYTSTRRPVLALRKMESISLTIIAPSLMWM